MDEAWGTRGDAAHLGDDGGAETAERAVWYRIRLGACGLPATYAEGMGQGEDNVREWLEAGSAHKQSTCSEAFSSPFIELPRGSALRHAFGRILWHRDRLELCVRESRERGEASVRER